MYCNLHVFVFFPAVCTIKTGMTMPKKRAKSCDLGRFYNTKYGRNGRTQKCPIVPIQDLLKLQFSDISSFVLLFDVFLLSDLDKDVPLH